MITGRNGCLNGKLFCYVLFLLMLVNLCNGQSTNYRINFKEEINLALRMLAIDLDSALILSKQVLDNTQKVNDSWSKMIAYSTVGYVNHKMRRYDLAYLNYSIALNYTYETDTVDLYNKTDILRNMSIIQNKFGYIKQSIDFQTQALAVGKRYLNEATPHSEKWNQVNIVSDMEFYLARMYNDYGETQKADSLLSLLIKKSEESGYLEMKSKVLNELGIVAYEALDFQRAKYNFNQVIELGGAPAKNRAIAYHNLGAVYKDLTNFDMSEASFLKALALKESLGNGRSVFITYLDLGILYFENRLYYKAIEQFKMGLFKFNKPDTPELFVVYKWIYKAYEMLGEKEMALGYRYLFDQNSQAYSRSAEVVSYERQAEELRHYMGIEKDQSLTKQLRDKHVTVGIYIILIGSVIFISIGLFVRKRKRRKLYRELGEILLEDSAKS